MILRRGSKAKATLMMDKLECEGVATVDRDQWKAEVEKHCKKKYEDGSRTVADAMAEVDVSEESAGDFGGDPPGDSSGGYGECQSKIVERQIQWRLQPYSQ